MRELSRTFVVGSARSGTTLLQSLLAAHSHVFSPPETHFMQSLPRGRTGIERLGLVARTTRRSANESLKAAGLEAQNMQLPRFGVFTSQYVRGLGRVLDAAATAKGASAWVEKTPHHLHHVDRLGKHIPDARFLHIIRDGRDVVASLFEVTKRYPHRWGGALSIDQCIDRWCRDVRVSQRYLSNPRHMVVTYDEIVEDTERSVRVVCEFIGIGFQEAQLEDYSIAAAGVTGRNETWKADVSGQIGSRAGRKFQQVFSRAEQEYVGDRLRRHSGALFDLLKMDVNT